MCAISRVLCFQTLVVAQGILEFTNHSDEGPLRSQFDDWDGDGELDVARTRESNSGNPHSRASGRSRGHPVRSIV